MSKLDELIQQLCPDGVEWKKIKDHFTRLRGTAITAGKMKEIEEKQGDVRIFAGGKTVINAFEKDIPNANITRVPSVLVQSRGIIDVVYYKQPFTFKNEMWAYTSDYNVSVKFLFYYLKNNIEDLRQAAISMGAMPQISLSATEEMFIPLPPLPVQEEIVRLLDQLTETTEKYQAELEAELDVRKKQYEEYRNKLLDLEGKENVEKKKILDLLSQSITDGPHETPELYESGIPFLSAEAIIDNKLDFNHARGFISEEYDAICSKKYKPQFNDVYMCKSGSTTGKVAINDTNVNFNIWSPLAALRVNDNNSARYLFYLLQTNKVQTQVKKNASHGSQPNLSMRKLEQFDIVVPNLSEQERIVDILDRMDKTHKELCQSIETEIKMRKQQYEYYRDKLLTFKKKEE